MLYITKATAAGILLSFSLCHAQISQCVPIANALQEVSMSASSSEVLDELYSQNCTQSGSYKSRGINLGIKTIIQDIPIDLTGGFTSEDQMFENFCRTYQTSRYARETRDTYNRKIAKNAIATVNSCLELANQETIIKHNLISITDASFYLRSAPVTKIEIRGVNKTPNIECSGVISNKAEAIGPNTIARIQDTFSFHCTRNARTDSASGSQFFDEGIISIQTNVKNYDVIWRKDSRVPDNVASSLDYRISKLEAETNYLRSQNSYKDEVIKNIYENIATRVKNGEPIYLRSTNAESQFIRHSGSSLRIDPDKSPPPFEDDRTWIIHKRQP